MVLAKKRQVLAAKEGLPGTQVTSFAASNNVDVIDPSWASAQELLDRRPASPSLGRRPRAVGRDSAQITQMVEFRGSGTATTLPEYSLYLESAGLITDDVVNLQLTSGISSAVDVGDKLTGGTSGAVAYVAASAGAGATTIRVIPISGTWSGAESVDSEWVGASIGTTTGSPLSSATGKYWQPTTTPYLTFQTSGAWSPAPSVGETIHFTVGAVIVGSGRFVGATGNTTTMEWVWGTIPLSAAIASTSGKSNTVNASDAQITQTRIPTLSIQDNRAGLVRTLFAARSNFTLSANTGEQARLAFEFTGKIGTSTDASFTPGVALPSTVAPRFKAGTLVVDGAKFPVKSYSFTPGNEVVMVADGNVQGGNRVAYIADRDPTWQIELEQLGVAVTNWEQIISNATAVVLALQMGSSVGNRMSLIARNNQVESWSDGDAEGTATHSVTLKPLEETVAGEDDFYIAQS